LSRLEAKLEAKDSTSLFTERCLKKATSFAFQLCLELLKMSLEEGQAVLLLLLNPGSSKNSSLWIRMRLFLNTCRPLLEKEAYMYSKRGLKDLCSASLSTSIASTSIVETIDLETIDLIL